MRQLNQTGRGGKFGSLYFLFFFQGRGGRCEGGERTAGVPDPRLSHLPPEARSPGSSSDPGRAAGERRPARVYPRRVWAPRGCHGRGAAVRGPGSALTPGSQCLARGATRRLVPTHLLSPRAPVPDLSLFLSHIFLICFHSLPTPSRPLLLHLLGCLPGTPAS